MPTGYLMRDSEHKDENRTKRGKKEWQRQCSKQGEWEWGSNGGPNGGGVSESKDHEVAVSQLKNQRNIERKWVKGKRYSCLDASKDY